VQYFFLRFFSFCSQAVDRILAHLRARFATYFAMFEQYAQKNVFHVPELDFSVRVPKTVLFSRVLFFATQFVLKDSTVVPPMVFLFSHLFWQSQIPSDRVAFNHSVSASPPPQSLNKPTSTDALGFPSSSMMSVDSSSSSSSSSSSAADVDVDDCPCLPGHVVGTAPVSKEQLQVCVCKAVVVAVEFLTQ
jgi:hypothetical protein